MESFSILYDFLFEIIITLFLGALLIKLISAEEVIAFISSTSIEWIGKVISICLGASIMFFWRFIFLSNTRFSRFLKLSKRLSLYINFFTLSIIIQLFTIIIILISNYLCLRLSYLITFFSIILSIVNFFILLLRIVALFHLNVKFNIEYYRLKKNENLKNIKI